MVDYIGNKSSSSSSSSSFPAILNNNNISSAIRSGHTGGGNGNGHGGNGNCTNPTTEYLDIEQVSYLYMMCPLAFIGILLNLISLKIFYDKTFSSVTFKYIRLITWTDCFICLIIIPYCLTAYTQPFNKYDYYARNLYLAYVYIPGANIAINLSMFLNLLVTIERLVSVALPMQKHKLFKPSRYRLSCLVVLGMAISFNFPNFFLYSVSLCESVIPNSFASSQIWAIYGYIREILTRVVPIIALVIANIILIGIVRTSRRRMNKNSKQSPKQSTTSAAATTTTTLAAANRNEQKKLITGSSPVLNNNTTNLNSNNNELLISLLTTDESAITTTTTTNLVKAKETLSISCNDITIKNLSSNINNNSSSVTDLVVVAAASSATPDRGSPTALAASAAAAAAAAAAAVVKGKSYSLGGAAMSTTNNTKAVLNVAQNLAAKRNRQDNQLTWMTIMVAIIYTITTVPMVFAYPGLLFKAEELSSRSYKIYALAVNILELFQCSSRFLIYFCFTTQFRNQFYTMFFGNNSSKNKNGNF